MALSTDAKVLLFGDRGDTAGTSEAAYLRSTDGSPAVRLGEGNPMALSPDGKWAIVYRNTPDPHFVLLPTGPGQARSLSTTPVVPRAWVKFHPDGTRIFFVGSVSGQGRRVYQTEAREGLTGPGDA